MVSLVFVTTDFFSNLHFFACNTVKYLCQSMLMNTQHFPPSSMDILVLILEKQKHFQF